MSELPPQYLLEHSPLERLRATARPGFGSLGAVVFGPAHGDGIEAPGLAVTDAAEGRGIMRSVENRSSLTTMQASAAHVSPAPAAWGPCLPPFAVPAQDSRSGPAARGHRDVRDVAPPTRTRRSLFRRWGRGQ